MFYDNALMLSVFVSVGILAILAIGCFAIVVDDCDKTMSYSFYTGK